MTLMKSQFAPCRSLSEIPIPLQRKNSGPKLLEKWNPESIVFMIDVFTGRHHFDDDLPPADHEPTDDKKRMGPHISIYSKAIKVPSLSSKIFQFDHEMQISPDRMALDAIEDFYDET